MVGTLRRPAIFAIIGAANTVVDFAVYYALTRGFGVLPVPANAVGYVAGSCHGYFANGLITFRHSGTRLWSLRTAGRAVLATLISLSVSSLSMYILVAVVDDLVAKLITTFVTFVANYSLSRHLTYRSG